MPIYEISADRIVPFELTSFEAAGLRERGDLQRLLKTQIEIVCPDVLVISEGFREWEDSRRELDLLAIDKDANLVVIELKRTEDAGHAELQAIRYAAMVSAMTFSRAVDVYEDYMHKNNVDGDAASDLLEFLNWEEADEDRFAQDVHIVLVSADFSKELTTSVMFVLEAEKSLNKARFDWLFTQRVQIEKAVRNPLDWQRCDDLKRSYIALHLEGGYRDAPENWATIQDQMINAMLALEAAVSPLVNELRRVVPRPDSESSTVLDC